MTNRTLQLLRPLARAAILTVAVLYFLIDLIFFSMIRPLRNCLLTLHWVHRMREWVGRLNRYAALFLLLVPWLILEPVKPIGFLLFAHKHHFSAVVLIIGGELFKLTLFEQLFNMTKPKLMSFRWFALCYCTWRAAIEYLKAIPLWQRMLGLSRAARAWIRRRLLAG